MILSADMALNDKDRLWITQAIQSAHATYGWGSIKRFIKEWSFTGAAVAITLFTINQWNQNTKFQTHTEDRLTTIESQLLTLRASSSPSPVLKEIGNLDGKRFAKALPALSKVVQQPVAEVNPSSATLLDVAQKLKDADHSDPVYWPTVFQFVQFASAGLSPDVPPETDAPFRLESLNIDGRVLGVLRHRVLRLDGVTMQNARFENCRIIFEGNPTHLINVTFVNCVFEIIGDTNNPSPYQKHIGQEILASNLTNVVINTDS
jgi:hypothetical protein